MSLLAKLTAEKPSADKSKSSIILQVEPVMKAQITDLALRFKNGNVSDLCREILQSAIDELNAEADNLPAPTENPDKRGRSRKGAEPAQ
jgi:hypothetical protein